MAAKKKKAAKKAAKKKKVTKRPPKAKAKAAPKKKKGKAAPRRKTAAKKPRRRAKAAESAVGLSAQAPAAALPRPQAKEGRFELRIILLVVAVVAALVSYFMLSGEKDVSMLSTRAVAMVSKYHTNQIPVGDQRLFIRYTTESQNYHVWLDLLPPGEFFPPLEGSTDFTVLEHNHWDGRTLIYKPGPWEKALMDAYQAKKK